MRCSLLFHHCLSWSVNSGLAAALSTPAGRRSSTSFVVVSDGFLNLPRSSLPAPQSYRTAVSSIFLCSTSPWAGPWRSVLQLWRHGRNISVSRSSHGALQLSLTLHCGCCWSCDQCRRSSLWPWFCLDALLEMTRTCRSCFVLLISNSAVVQSCWHSVTRRPLNLLFLSLSFVSAIYSLWSLLSDFPSKIKILFTRMTLTTTCSAHFLLFHFKTGRWYFGICVLVTCGESSILQKNSSCWFPAPCFYLWTLLQQLCMIYSW